MKKILRGLFVLPWRLMTWLRAALANLLMFILVMLLGFSLFGQGKQATLPAHALLYVKPGNAIVEQRSFSDPLSSVMQQDEDEPQETVLREMTSAIRWAAHDNHIKGMVINADYLAGSDLGKLESIAQAIKQFKSTGKPVIAVGDSFSQGQYYLASLADKIYLNPMGSVQIYGFGAYQTYLKDLLDKLAINVHIFRAGEFKSFVEPFVRNEMSAEARENLQQWMDEQWYFYSHAIEERRQLAPGSLNNYINTQDQLLTENSNNPAALAIATGLVDGLATRTEAQNIINTLAGQETADTIDTDAYYQHIQERNRASSLLADKAKIAVIHAVGNITEGHQPPGSTGAETLIEQIHRAQEDSNIAAVVLRIDSPGGSAFASELIRSELANLQATGKPVVASMGGVAASGGYWIAASANEIWASPTTITGSIGVFGIIPTFENSMNKLGVHSDGYSTTALADAMQADRPMNPLAARITQQGVDFTYGEFLRLVSQGRSSTPQAIDRIAQGRVWTGKHAQELKLVDHMGELDDAIGAAARLAKLKDYEVDYVEPELGPFETLLQDFASSNSSALLGTLQDRNSSLRNAMALLTEIPALKALAELKALNDPNHLYVRCWECGTGIR